MDYEKEERENGCVVMALTVIVLVLWTISLYTNWY
jgi:hypothetical protein